MIHISFIEEASSRFRTSHKPLTWIEFNNIKGLGFYWRIFSHSWSPDRLECCMPNHDQSLLTLGRDPSRKRIENGLRILGGSTNTTYKPLKHQIP